MNQEEQFAKAKRLVENEVYANQNRLVETLLEKEIASYEDMINVYVDPSEWSVAQCRQWLEENGEEEPFDYNPYRGTAEELRLRWLALFYDYLDGAETTEDYARLSSLELPDLQQKLQEYYEQEYEAEQLEEWHLAVTGSRAGQDAAEVYEWWLVSSYLREELRNRGEVILDCEHVDEAWWGRGTTGQAIYMDYVIQQIANERI